MPASHTPSKQVQLDNATNMAHQQPSPSLVLLFATGAGLSAASLYYSQPMLGILAADLGVRDVEIGFAPSLTQFGYALGILLLAPLGDRHNRRHIILSKSVLLVTALLLMAFSQSLGTLLIASLAIGLTATLAQDIVPAAASMTHESQRGRVVGTVMTGLLLGVLLSRVISGFVAEHLGWRAMFILAAASILANLAQRAKKVKLAQRWLSYLLKCLVPNIWICKSRDQGIEIDF